MSPSLSLPPQIRAHVELLHKKHGKYRVFGIRMSVPAPVSEHSEVNGRECFFNWCDSVLQIRELLFEREKDDALQVVLTNLNEADLGQDLLARFAKKRFFTDDAWQILQERFQARQTDPMLRKHRWLAEMLIENMPPGGYPPVTNGLLDANTVWGIVLKEHLAFDNARPDARDLLAWMMNTEKTERYLCAPTDIQQGVRGWLQQSAGAIAEILFNCLDVGLGEDAVPLGLACQVVFSEVADPAIEAALSGAVIRMEQFTGGHPLTKSQAETWRDAAVGLIDRLPQEEQKTVANRMTERADDLLVGLKIAEYAWLSPHSPAGFEQMMERYGLRVQELLKNKFAELPEDAPQLAETIFRHRQALDGGKRSPRAEVVEMSLRLLRWLTAGQADYHNFEEAALAYAQDGGFVDRARQALYRGDRVGPLSEAYMMLADAITSRREVENRQFAELLAKWTESGSRSEDVIKIEDVLHQVVAEVAKSAPVLLVVMDGMGYAVFRELLEEITDRGWVEIAPERKTWPTPVIAALPSITEVSRASLLCGRLTRGTSSDEAAGFGANEALRNLSRTKPPILFHKNSLAELGRNENSDLLQELASEKRKVVGVVINVVDDHLLKGEQLSVPWKLEHIPTLEHLLYAARDAGRAVIVTADHGHVLERQTIYRQPASPATAGERYRGADGRTEADELLISGSRVISGKIIAPWSERVRYAMKKHGYHGGLTPQECVVPCCVLVKYNQKLGEELSEWVERPLYQPAWWSRPEPARTAPLPKLSSTAKRPRKTATTSMPLFAGAEGGAVDWIERLITSEVFANQLALAGRGAPKPEEVRKFLEALAVRGGATLKLTIAQQLGHPELRIAGIIAAIRRVLNVDGYAVLEVEEPSGTIRLNLTLLKVQFGLDDHDD
jgi:PglZ domain